MLVAPSKTFSHRLALDYLLVVWRDFATIDPLALIFSVPAVFIGYTAMAAPGAFAGWALVGGCLFASVGLFAAGGRAAMYRIVRLAINAGLASGSDIINKAALLHVCHQLSWRTLIAAAGLMISAVALSFWGGQGAAIILVMLFSGTAFMVLAFISPMRTIDLALGALQPPTTIRNNAACSLVFWPPARTLHLRNMDRRNCRRSGRPTRLAMIQANLSRYKKDGRGPLPDKASAFCPDDRAEAKACWSGLLCYYRHLLPIALLLAILGFPFANMVTSWIVPYFPPAPFEQTAGEQAKQDTDDAWAPSTKKNARLTSSKADAGSGGRGDEGNEADAQLEGGSSTRGDGGSAQGGRTRDGAGNTGNASGSTGSSAQRNGEGAGNQIDGAPVSGEKPTANAGAQQSSAQEGSGGEGGSQSAETGSGSATGEMAQGPSRQEEAAPESDGAPVPGAKPTATTGAQQRSAQEGAGGEGGPQSAETGSGSATAEMAQEPSGRSEAAPEVDVRELLEVNVNLDRDADEGSDRGNGDANSETALDASSGPNSGGTAESGDKGDPPAPGGGPMNPVINFASRADESGGNEGRTRIRGDQPDPAPVPPQPNWNETVEPPGGDDLLLKSVAVMYGPKGRVPEHLRVFRLNSLTPEEMPTPNEKMEPTQNLPAWIRAIVDSSTNQ